jgi:hypothetical protein
MSKGDASVAANPSHALWVHFHRIHLLGNGRVQFMAMTDPATGIRIEIGDASIQGLRGNRGQPKTPLRVHRNGRYVAAI